MLIVCASTRRGNYCRRVIRPGRIHNWRMELNPAGDISYIGRTNFRATHTLFGIRQADRLSHLYVIGKTGVGKSTLLETLALQDLAAGRGFALIDPHGDLAERIFASVTPEQE